MAPFDRFIRSKTPAQRWGKTEDLQGLAVFLASPASDFINGQVVYIDGGILAYIGQDPSQLDESKFRDVEGVEDIKVADN
jgi:gluconate 5-dehydrogenase